MKSLQKVLSCLKFALLSTLYVLHDGICEGKVCAWIGKVLHKFEVRVHFDKGIDYHETNGLAHFVAIDLFKQVVSLLEHVFKVLVILDMVAHTVVLDSTGVYQPTRVIDIPENAQVIDVSLNVVKLIRIYSVSCV